MSDKIQITEEQARQMAEIIKIDSADILNVRINKIIDLWKQYDYIEKTAVEEAEELLDQWRSRTNDSDNQVFNLITKQHEAIQELKEKLEKYT